MRVFTIVLRKVTRCNLEASNVTKKRKAGILGAAFGKHLFFTNTISSGLLMAVGDYCQQRIEMYQAKPNDKPYDMKRTVNMSIVALGHGVFHHFFYGWLDRKFPGTNLRHVMNKILIDQIVASPACMWIFFIGMALLERRGYESGWLEMKKKFLFCYVVDWVVWPPNQFINFYYVPSQYRVVYINSLTMLYDVFLSYLKFYDQSEEVKEN